MTTVLFNHECETIHDRLELADIQPMTDKDYSVRGCTALLDALGDTIRHIAQIHRYARPEDVPEHTTFVIMTDGVENASKHFSSDEVKRQIEHEKEKYGWEFLFLAANIDAVQTAKNVGINADRAVDYRADSIGTQAAYDAVAETECMARMGKPISADWCNRVKEDFNKRQ